VGTGKSCERTNPRWRKLDEQTNVYDGFFCAVGAPTWHGRNLDALTDGISGGSINQVEVPYRVIIKNYDKIAALAKQMADSFVDLIRELEGKGCPVEVRVEGQ
jgi:RNAse (barnase) inhibitor barstar